ncbi:unnamed protein product, partial [Sphagnum balticum]
TLEWKKHVSSVISVGSSRSAPMGKRSHTAVLYGDAMHIYGGYQDLRGSSSEIWTFDFG